MITRLPSFEQCSESPTVSDDFQGVTIALPERVDLAKTEVLPVFGVFQIDDDVADSIAGGDPFRALVMLFVNTDGYHPYCFHVAGRAIMLERGLSPKGKFRGYFNVNCFEKAQIRPQAGRFFISAYLDQFQSLPMSVDVVGEVMQ